MDRNTPQEPQLICAQVSFHVKRLAIITLTKVPQDVDYPARDRPDAYSIHITPAMIEAGVMELRERCIGEPLADIVTDVFVVMLAAWERANSVIPQDRLRPSTMFHNMPKQL